MKTDVCVCVCSFHQDYEDFFQSKENNTVFTFLGLSSPPSSKGFRVVGSSVGSRRSQSTCPVLQHFTSPGDLTIMTPPCCQTL
ncbi:unnamed protein product [Oncorhynchus mykiss]|uniref:Uncharacterized protein n=1 Tax=Oncorhynchus mykiss TaxID=8022 RepID=A0A060YX82_ONCMY|nr:unnamed protein product [Oncorhynchus mykiss]